MLSDSLLKRGEIAQSYTKSGQKQTPTGKLTQPLLISLPSRPWKGVKVTKRWKVQCERLLRLSVRVRALSSLANLIIPQPTKKDPTFCPSTLFQKLNKLWPGKAFCSMGGKSYLQRPKATSSPLQNYKQKHFFNHLFHFILICYESRCYLIILLHSNQFNPTASAWQFLEI